MIADVETNDVNRSDASDASYECCNVKEKEKHSQPACWNTMYPAVTEGKKDAT